MEEEIDTDVNVQVENDCPSDSDDEELSAHHRVSSALQTIDWNDLPSVMHQTDLGLQVRDMLLAFRDHMKRCKLVLRASYKGNGFQMFPAKDFQRASVRYMSYMGVYLLVQKLNGTRPELITQTYLLSIVDQVQTMVDDLYQSQCLNIVQHTAMSVERSQVQLNYLYFVPDNEKVNARAR